MKEYERYMKEYMKERRKNAILLYYACFVRILIDMSMQNKLYIMYI